MTKVIGSLTSLISSIKIDDNIPLPSKRQKEEKHYVEIANSEPLVAAKPTEYFASRTRLTPGHLRWRSVICRYKRNERIW